MQDISFETNIDGNVITNYVIATYHDDETNKDFIVYTDRTINGEGKLNVYYSLYKYSDGIIMLLETNDAKDNLIGLNLLKEIGKMYL